MTIQLINVTIGTDKMTTPLSISHFILNHPRANVNFQLKVKVNRRSNHIWESPSSSDFRARGLLGGAALPLKGKVELFLAPFVITLHSPLFGL